MLAQGTESESAEILTEDTIERLVAGLFTPLQIEQYLTHAFEAAYQVGKKLVTVEIIDSALAADLDALEATLTRYGYNARALAELLNAQPAVPRSCTHSCWQQACRPGQQTRFFCGTGREKASGPRRERSWRSIYAPRPLHGSKWI